MSLELDIALQRGSLRLELALLVRDGETLALVGPNGAGKSSCLMAIAGLLRIERGCIACDGSTLDGGSAGAFVPPEARRVGYLPQAPLLFPHLSVRENVAYGLRSRGRDRASARRAAEEWLRRVDLLSVADAKPAELSGGQAQRVALARALAPEPRLLLLDEPLSAVDASARLALRRELQRHLAEFTGPRLIVTHDAVDAFVLGDRIAVLEEGRAVQVGSAEDIRARPRSRYVADLVGLNFCRGVVQDSVLVTANGAQLVVASTVNGPAIASVHPRAIALFREKPSGSPRNVWRAPIDALEPSPAGVRIRLGGDLPLVAEVTPAAVRELRLEVGAAVWIALKATEVQVAPS